jgi:hypothetical protein
MHVYIYKINVMEIIWMHENNVERFAVKISAPRLALSITQTIRVGSLSRPSSRHLAVVLDEISICTRVISTDVLLCLRISISWLPLQSRGHDPGLGSACQAGRDQPRPESISFCPGATMQTVY